MRCRIWKNTEARNPAKPELTPYTVGMQWRDGMVRQANFAIDEDKLALFASQQYVDREALLLQMVSLATEQLLAHRVAVKAAERAGKLILPTIRR